MKSGTGLPWTPSPAGRYGSVVRVRVVTVVAVRVVTLTEVIGLAGEYTRTF